MSNKSEYIEQITDLLFTYNLQLSQPWARFVQKICFYSTRVRGVWYTNVLYILQTSRVVYAFCSTSLMIFVYLSYWLQWTYTPPDTFWWQSRKHKWRPRTICQEFQPPWTTPHKDTNRSNCAAEAWYTKVLFNDFEDYLFHFVRGLESMH